MGTRQIRLLSPSPVAVTSYAGQLVQLILADGEVLHGHLAAASEVGPTCTVRLTQRQPARAVPFAAIRELIADREAGR